MIQLRKFQKDDTCWWIEKAVSLVLRAQLKTMGNWLAVSVLLLVNQNIVEQPK